MELINPHATPTSVIELAEALTDLLERPPISREGRETRAFEMGPEIASSKPHLHDRHQVALEFTGCNIVFPEAVEGERVEPWLEALPGSVIRAKALLTVTTDLNRRYLYERVGTAVSPSPIPVRSIKKVPCSGLFIGPDLRPDEILRLSQEKLHPLCHFPKS